MRTSGPPPTRGARVATAGRVRDESLRRVGRRPRGCRCRPAPPVRTPTGLAAGRATTASARFFRIVGPRQSRESKSRAGVITGAQRRDRALTVLKRMSAKRRFLRNSMKRLPSPKASSMAEGKPCRGFSRRHVRDNTRHPVRWRDATAARVRACGCAWAGRYASRARRCSSRCGCRWLVLPLARAHHPLRISTTRAGAHSRRAIGAIVGVLGRDRTRVGSVARLASSGLCCGAEPHTLVPVQASLSWRESVCAADAESTGLRREGATASRACCRGVRDAAGGGDTGSLLPHAPAQPRGSSPAASPVPLRLPPRQSPAVGSVHAANGRPRVGWRARGRGMHASGMANPCGMPGLVGPSWVCGFCPSLPTDLDAPC